MKNLFTKLNNRRGASILMALLLFLICALAGAAALTAAGSNVGRYSYIERDQQEYLAVSSAARLIRDQLSDLNAELEFTVNAPDDLDYIDFPRVVPGDENSICTSNDIQYLKSDYTKPESENVKYYRKADDGTNEDISDPKKDIVKFFTDELEKALGSAFYDYVTGSSFTHKDIWEKADPSLSAGDYSEPTFGDVNLTVTCPGLDFKDGGDKDAEVKALVYIDPAAHDEENGRDYNIKITVSYGDMAYELSGTLEVEVSSEEKSSPISRPYVMEDTVEPADPSIPKAVLPPVNVPSTMVTNSKITATATFKLDNVISRVVDTEEGGSGS